MNIEPSDWLVGPINRNTQKLPSRIVPNENDTHTDVRMRGIRKRARDEAEKKERVRCLLF